MMAEGRPIGTHGVDTRLSHRKVLGATSVAAALATGANLSAQAPAGRGQGGGVEVVGAQRSMEY